MIVLLNNALTHDENDDQKVTDSKIKDQTRGPKVALVKIGPRYGLLEPQDSKGKKWLAFWLFPPGEMPLPWLGPLNASEFYDHLKFLFTENFGPKFRKTKKKQNFQ